MNWKSVLAVIHPAWGVAPLPPAAQRALDEDRRGISEHDPGARRIVAEGIAWLGRAQDASVTADGGVARHYSLLSGWGASYPETTGYIVPTMLAYGAEQGDDGIIERARRMLDWLVSIQFDNGAFQGGMITERPVRPVTFNSGQILLGLAAGQRHFGTYLEPMKRTADWLARTQDVDGCWRVYPSPFVDPGDKAYDTHVAWGLLEAARVTPVQEYVDAALANIRWAISRQRANGWPEDCCLGEPMRPLTHTLGYFLRGVIEGYLFSKEQELLTAARKTADALMGAVCPDGSLPGRLDSDWRAGMKEVCVTGSSQIAHCWLQLYQITGNEKYREAGRRVNAWVRRTIKLEGPAEVRGAAKGSLPADGDYCRYEYPNWATKFTIDSNMLELAIDAAASPRQDIQGACARDTFGSSQ